MAIEPAKQREIGVILSYVNMGVNAIIGIVYVPILLSGIGQDEYGLYQLVGSIISWISIIGSIFSAGVTRYYCKFLSQNDEEGMNNTLAIGKRIYHGVSVLISILGIVAIIAFRAVYAGSISEEQLNESAFIIAVLIVNLIVTVNNSINLSVITAHEHFIFLRVVQVSTLCLQPLFVVIAIVFEPYALTVCCVQLTLNIVSASIQRLYVRRKLGVRPVLRQWDHGLFKGLLLFSGTIVMVMIADQVFWRTNQMIIGYYSGTAIVAVYGVASQLYMVYMSIGTAPASVFMPRVSRIIFEEDDERQLSHLFSKVGRITAYPLIAVLLGFAIFGQDFVFLWAGENYADAYWIALIIMTAYTFDLVQHMGLTILQVMEKYAFRGWVNLVIAALNIALVILAVPHFGAIGAAAISAVLLFLGNCVVMNIYYAKEIGLDIGMFWRNFIQVMCPLACLGVVAGGLFHAIELPCSWPILVLSMLVFAVAFAVIAYLFSANEEERNLIKGYLGRFKLRERK